MGRVEKLELWLEAISAKKLAVLKLPGKSRDSSLTMSLWAVGGKTMIVMRQQDGWDLYLPACEKNDVKLTIEAAAQYLGTGGLELVQDSDLYEKLDLENLLRDPEASSGQTEQPA